MNRSIFQILKKSFKFNVNILVLYAIFNILCYFFGFFNPSIALCEPGFLTRTVIYGKTYLHSPSIDLARLQLVHEQLHNFLQTASYEHYNFNLYKYQSLKGLIFPRAHPYVHPNINLYINTYVEQILNVHINIQLSHNQLNDFKIFADYDIYGNRRIQYINNITSVYDLKEIYPVSFADQKIKSQFIKINFEKIIEHYKTI